MGDHLVECLSDHLFPVAPNEPKHLPLAHSSCFRLSVEVAEIVLWCTRIAHDEIRDVCAEQPLAPDPQGWNSQPFTEVFPCANVERTRNASPNVAPVTVRHGPGDEFLPREDGP